MRYNYPSLPDFDRFAQDIAEMKRLLKLLSDGKTIEQKTPDESPIVNVTENASLEGDIF